MTVTGPNGIPSASNAVSTVATEGEAEQEGQPREAQGVHPRAEPAQSVQERQAGRDEREIEEQQAGNRPDGHPTSRPNETPFPASASGSYRFPSVAVSQP